MILILSENKDVTANFVANWLRYYQVPFLKINEDTDLNILQKIELNEKSTNIFFKVRDVEYSLDSFKVVWNRRGFIKFDLRPIDKIISGIGFNSSIKNAIHNHIRHECTILTDYIYHKLSQIKYINHPSKYTINKLIVLDEALKIGLKIPKTLITQKLQDLTTTFDSRLRIPLYLSRLSCIRQ